MSIEITIRQKLFGRKRMPLEVILGEDLHYGTFINDRLKVGELGKDEFIAYNPESIGRGFSVVWNPDEKRKIELRLPQPSTERETSEFYAAVERMAKHWNAKLTVDGSPVLLGDFLGGLKDMVAFNDRIIRHFSHQILDGEHEILTLFSAMWPLDIGREEARAFIEDTKEYAVWLHTKQSVDARYAVPKFYAGEKGIFAVYAVRNDESYLFPREPVVPLGMIDPSTGRNLQCSNWKVLLKIKGEEEPVGEVEYAEFLRRVPENKIVRYDGNKVQILKMKKEEIRELLDF